MYTELVFQKESERMFFILFGFAYSSNFRSQLQLQQGSEMAPIYETHHRLTKRAQPIITSTTNTTSFTIQFSCQIPYGSNSTVRCNQALQSLTRAANQLETYIYLPEQVTISASFQSFCASGKLGQACVGVDMTLGHAAPAAMHVLTDDAASKLGLDPNYGYPSSLIRQYLPNDPDMLSTPVDISAAFNSDYNWYLDGTPNWGLPVMIAGGYKDQSSTQSYDLEQVAIHEFIHGLGFISAWGSWLDDLPDVSVPSYIQRDSFGNINGMSPQWIYDRLLSDSLHNVWMSSYATIISDSFNLALLSGNVTTVSTRFNSTIGAQIGRALISENGLFQTSNAVYIWYPSRGTSKKLLHGILSTPSPYASGSSLSHLDSVVYRGISSLLMRTSASRGVIFNQTTPGNTHGVFGRTLLGVIRSMGYVTLE